VLLDVMMPGLDGWRVAEQLLEESERTTSDHLPHRARRVPDSRSRLESARDYVRSLQPLDLAARRSSRANRARERDELRGEKLAELRSLMELS